MNSGNRKRAASQSVEANKLPSSVQDDIAAASPEHKSKLDDAPRIFCTPYSNSGNRKRVSSEFGEAKKLEILWKTEDFLAGLIDGGQPDKVSSDEEQSVDEVSADSDPDNDDVFLI